MTTQDETQVAPAEHHRRNESGFYRWGGELLPSVTTILSVVNKEHLNLWSAKMAAQESAREIELMDGGHRTLEEAHANILDWPARMTAPIRFRDWRGSVGSLMHHAIYARFMNQIEGKDLVEWHMHKAASLNLANTEEVLQQLALEALPYSKHAFLCIDELVEDVDAIGLEAMVVSLTHGFAGSLDLRGRLKGLGRRTTDFKSSNRMADTFVLQVSGYDNAEFIGIPETGEQFELDPSDGTAIIHVQPDKKPADCLHVWEPNDDTWEAFLCARQLWGWLNNVPKPNARIRRTLPGAEKKVRSPRF